MKWLVLPVLAVMLVACAAPVNENIVMRMSGTYQKSSEYRSGYTDGCSSGLKSRGDKDTIYFKDLNRYHGEYRLGWDDGMRLCSQKRTK